MRKKVGRDGAWAIIIAVWFVAVCTVIYRSTIWIFGTLPDSVVERNEFYGGYAVWVFVMILFSAMFVVAINEDSK